jgi:predicted RNase H-like HicB family nuclease
MEYTAITKEVGDWWIGWVEEIPGVNCQERTYEELLDTLKMTLKEALEENRSSAIPRHNEIIDQLANKICKDLGIPKAK